MLSRLARVALLALPVATSVVHAAIDTIVPPQTVVNLSENIDVQGTATLTLNGETREIAWSEYSMLTPDFRLIANDGHAQTEIDPGPVLTVRGEIIGEPGSVVAGALSAEGLTAMVWSADPDQSTWLVQPAMDLDAPEGTIAHRVRYAETTMPGACGVTDDEVLPFSGAYHTHNTRSNHSITIEDRHVAELCIEADYQLYLNQGSSVTETLNFCAAMINAISTIYERDLGFAYELTSLVVRTADDSDIYTTTDGGALLGQFADAWNASQPNARGDVIHLFSGREFDGAVIGVAWVNAACSGGRFGVNQVTCCDFDGRVALVSHEMGHNWGAGHCNDDPECRIMCSGLGGCSGLGNPVRFAPGSIAAIGNYVSGQDCLDDAVPGLPLMDRFTTSGFNHSMWAYLLGPQIVESPDATSAPALASLPGGGYMETVPFDASSISPVVTFRAKTDQTNPTAQLRIEYLTATGTWLPVASLKASDIGSTFTNNSFRIPSGGLHANAQVRFSTPYSDDSFWSIDDVWINPTPTFVPPLSLPFVDTFFEGALNLTRWSSTSASVTISPIGLPSAPYALRVPQDTSVETQSILAGTLASDERVQVSFWLAGDGASSVELFYRNSMGVEQTAGTYARSGTSGYEQFNILLPQDTASSGLRVRLRAIGGAASIDDVRIEIVTGGCSPADIAPDFGVLDVDDVLGFLGAFASGLPSADLAEPQGTLNIDDVLAFLSSFAAGCP